MIQKIKSVLLLIVIALAVFSTATVLTIDYKVGRSLAIFENNVEHITSSKMSEMQIEANTIKVADTDQVAFVLIGKKDGSIEAQQVQKQDGSISRNYDEPSLANKLMQIVSGSRDAKAWSHHPPCPPGTTESDVVIWWGGDIRIIHRCV